ncbi:hypothetical protein E7T06_07320 [Deinococcus sp. Arct2-2]|uniref:hypothetical protein n=1 Tax=Deinococcus sp. Arct2-2 TaxID=2568653 RepID=UPI0010A41295|nr:hypothetical protein [Deinococcus sp. Arct2-2]THF70507.1 hypothetical protein E7T06_07320 [Deinococcus sp. Arct2-2]
MLTLPLQGRAWADVTLALRAVPFKAFDQVQVALQDGKTYQMTVERIGGKGGFTSAYLVGGTGGLSRDIGPKFYQKIPAQKVLAELLHDCGEVPGTIDLPGILPMWVRAAGPAHEALRALMMRYPERVWRMRPSGEVDVMVPTWPEHAQAQRILHEDAAVGSYTVALDPTLRPGSHVTLSRGDEEFGKRVTRVSHSLTEEYGYPHNQVVLRSHLGTGDGEDMGITGLEATVQRAMRWTDYLALYDCEVLRDHGDHTLDLRPSNPQLPELTKVRLVQPIAGSRVKIKAGSVVLLSFQAGDPSRPVVLHYGTATLERLEIATGKGQLIRIDDDRGEVSPEDALYTRPHIRLQDKSGQSIELWAQDGAERVKVTDKAGQTVTLTPGSGDISVKANTSVNVTAADVVNIVADVINVNGGIVNLAGGGPAVGRVGDQVQVVGVMPGPATVTGTIISGSGRVFSG